jgi:hypothetical protein
MTVPARLRQWARRLLGVDAASAERDVARIRLEVKRALTMTPDGAQGPQRGE